MANSEHLSILKERGVDEWNQWRDNNPETVPDLKSAQLPRVMLKGANLRLAILRDANLNGADLRRAVLTDANLYNSKLVGANFSGAMLKGANLRHSILKHANFNAAKLEGSDFSGAMLYRTIWSFVDLRNVAGLDLAVHRGPSSIGIETIYESAGEISEAFLRGCGVPNNFVQYARSLVGQPIEFYSCFISYSTKDQEFADRLYFDLQANGVRCWFAPHHMKSGEKIHEQIDQAIHLHERLLLILSAASMESDWVKTEIAKARKREVKEQRRVLFPIRLVSFDSLREWECFDADIGRDSAREIREYFVPDFSEWKDDDLYRLSLTRLLEAMKAENGL